MNQILLTDDNNIKKKKSKQTSGNINNFNINNGMNNSNDIKKIIIFFSIVILVFGVAIAGIYGYKSLKKNDKKEQVISKPKIELSEASENPEEVTIKITSEVGISKFAYTWNNEEEIVEELNGRTQEEKNIEIPYGDNELKIRVVDVNGNEENATKNYYREEETNNIEISIVGKNNKLEISVESEKELASITYNWEGEEPVTVEGNNELTMEISIDVKRGLNDITITATDIDGTSNTITKPVEGKMNPEIDVYRDGSKVYMIIRHDQGLKKVEFIVNGKKYTYDETRPGYDKEKKELEYYFDLKEGENTVEITATSNEDTTDTTGKLTCNYTVEQ